MKGVFRNKTTSNNHVSHSHHELKGIDREKEREYWKKIIFQVKTLSDMEKTQHVCCKVVNVYGMYRFAISIMIKVHYHILQK